ncbi:HEAT repeat domain-containing protein [Nostoc sp. FACHB-133]|uniref:HEAT repeat domain-containing protein n=1 Tax=Nostoc sp. FACHB-133 TaxID=2692835 RepID=UPI0016889EB9|nr:HEAT repeat domain-containing protein [Nostoc sp. FACHB-133]MBD2522044.1 HEAT repeat domain-containing protein [Nostoc sp. FACHB-133]
MLVGRQKLTTNPLTLTEGVALQVDDVYVPLGLIERKKQSKRQGDVSPEQGSELYKETEITKTFEHGAFLEEVLKQKNTPKSKGKRIAIIGEPGAGKTTLLQQIADWVFRKIDQSIVIWVSLADLRGQELKAYLFETWLTQVAEKIGKAETTKQLKDNFVAQFNQNNVWLLLDGLDEMSASSGNPLTEIARQFREGGLISQARIVLTCRVNLWDGSINALDDFDTYCSLGFFDPEEVEKFIHKWFTAIPKTGKQLCTALKESGKERIQDLVKNPLRLTLLCFNWQSGDGKLPDTQAGLYQQFVDDFYKWKKDEFATNSHQRQKLNVKLGKLAKAAIHREATRFRLQQDFVNQFLGDVDDEKSLLKLALNRGWLNSIGIDELRKPVYAFFHASFQEYFAAKAIDDWHFFLNHVPKNPSQGTYRIFEPQWKQTILLWLGREEENLKQQKQEFIDALVNFKDECWNIDDFYKGFYEYRAYFLAAAGIAEFRDDSRADEIIVQIIKWCFGHFYTKKQEWIQFPYPIEKEAKSALQQTDRKKAIAALVRLLQSDDVPVHIRWQVEKSLVEIGTGNEMAIIALVQLLQSNDVDKDNHSNAAYSLGEIGTGNQMAIAALVKFLQSEDVLDETRSKAAKSLGKIATGNEMAIIALVQLLQSEDVHDYTRRAAAESLGKIGTDHEMGIRALVQLLQSPDVDHYTCKQAAKSLGTIDPGNQIAIIALVKLLQSKDVSNSIGIQAAESLGIIDPGNQTAIAALVQLLQSKDLHEDTRIYAAKSLGKIDLGNEMAIAALVQLLQSNQDFRYKYVDYDIRRRAAYSLKTIDPGNEMAITALVQLLESNNMNYDIVRQVAECLGIINPGNKIAIAALVQLLQLKDVSDSIRKEAASNLGEMGINDKLAIAALVKLLQSNNVDHDTHRQAAKSLGIIDPGNTIAIKALVQLLQSNIKDYITRMFVASSLSEILHNNQDRFEVVNVLIAYQQFDGNSYSVLWKCAQNMPYPDFHQAWHQHNVATRAMRSLKKILFTRII